MVACAVFFNDTLGVRKSAWGQGVELGAVKTESCVRSIMWDSDHVQQLPVNEDCTSRSLFGGGGGGAIVRFKSSGSIQNDGSVRAH